jgi:hypothetical protein
MLSGLGAYRVGKKLADDGAAGRVTNNAEANELLRRTYRNRVSVEWLTDWSVGLLWKTSVPPW